MSRALLPFAVLAAAVCVAAPVPLRVKASPAVAPCAAAAGAEYARATGVQVVVETAALLEASSAEGADVVVGADAELNRIIESGASNPELDVDVARIPWVLATAAGSASPDVATLARSTSRVRVLGGAVSREALRVLAQKDLTPANVQRIDGSAGRLRLAPGEAAIVPLSLAGPGAVSILAVPPITARALGVRSSRKAAAARAFLDFLGGPGNAAFVACGRSSEAR